METMRAARLLKYGEEDAVQMEEIPVPPVTAGKVLIEVHAAGVNPFDWKLRAGYFEKMIPLELPVTLGGDFSGMVIEVGADVQAFKKGEEVYGQASILAGGSGSFTELALASADAIALKPKNLDHTNAGGLPLAGVSAVQALMHHIHLQAGQKILIHGGAGGIGSLAIQVARHLGAHVAATASGDDLPYLRALGATEVINYRTDKFEDIVRDYDAVFDTVGGETYRRSFGVLRPGGILVSMLEAADEELMQKYGVTAISQQTQITRVRLEELARLAEQGAVKVHIEKVFPLGEAAAALNFLQAGHPRGKVVIEMN